jgi:hypothetical protein
VIYRLRKNNFSFKTILLFGGAFPLVFSLFVLSATAGMHSAIEKSGSDLVMAIALFFSAIKLIKSHGRRVFNGISSPFIIIFFIFSVCLNFAYLDNDFAINSIIKFFYMCLVAQLASDIRFKPSIMISADIVFGLTILIVFLSSLGIVSSLTFETVDRVKFTGGFNNPNTGPFLIFSSFLVYVFFQNLRRSLFAVISIFYGYFYMNISSNTVIISATTVLLMWLLMVSFNKYIFSFLVKLLIISLFSFGLICYMLPFAYPEILINQVDGPIDIITSFRIWILAYDFVVPVDSWLGFRLNPVDSTYVEIIYFAGPVFLCLLVSKLFKLTMMKFGKSQFGVYLFLIGLSLYGLMETSLYTLTTTSLLVVAFTTQALQKLTCAFEPMDGVQPNVAGTVGMSAPASWAKAREQAKQG